jgi:hypothetical protein
MKHVATVAIDQVAAHAREVAGWQLTVSLA